ncbi:siderophore-interacting protein [Microlunatus kandeliicorticis]|uniref:siderophore-interacting protein n=1 Tax=Microlunatus kandeliicorticis TaxID=1759536 RepID=UPI0015FC2895|nr:SIP domain-containing protein [Microlunatus kandeliicorticis]
MFVPRPHPARVVAVRRRSDATTVVLDAPGWRSTGLADEWVHLWVPGPGGRSGGDGPRRLYSVVDVDPLTLELAHHSPGPAGRWAGRAAAGHRVLVSQPAGRHRPPRDARWEVVVADHTGLPAARRIVAGSPPGRRLLLVLETDDADVPAPEPAGATVVRVFRPDLAEPSALAATVDGLELPDGPGYLWLGAEVPAARAVRRRLRAAGWPPHRYAVSGYWQRRDPGHADRYRAVADRVAALYAEVETGVRDPEAVADDLDDLLDRHRL